SVDQGRPLLRGVLVMVADPALYAVPFLLPTERRQVKEVVRVEGQIKAPLVGRVRVKDTVAFAQEDAQAGQLALLRPELARLHQLRGVRVVVLDAARVLVQRDVEVVVEVAAKG